MKNNICNVCFSNDLHIQYEGKIRNGTYGSVTEDIHRVLKCGNCKNVFLSYNPNSIDFHNTDEYRIQYNNTTDKQYFWNTVGNENELRISRIGIKAFVGKTVIDIGVGSGMFLDIIHGVTKETIAIEPAKFFHEELSKYHRVYSYGADVVADKRRGDVVLSFNVIEHIPNPIEFLKEIRALLNDGGIAYLMTPNHNDILMELIPDIFQPFYYKSAHLYYFDEKSITYCLEEAGFTNYKIGYMHTMDMSNMMLWLKDKRPMGIGNLQLFDEGFNTLYKNYLEENGKANYLWVEFRK